MRAKLLTATRPTVRPTHSWSTPKRNKCNKKLIRRWDSEREPSLRRHRTHTTKYNRLVHKFCHR